MILTLVPSQTVLSFSTKAPFNLCSDISERYLAASIDVSYSHWIIQKQNKISYRKQFTSMTVVQLTKLLLFAKNMNPLLNLHGVELGKTIYLLILKQSWCFSSSQLGYCIRDSPKFHVLSVSTHHDNDIFVHRILQCNKTNSQFKNIKKSEISRSHSTI